MKRIRRMSRNMIPLSFSGNELSTLDEDETDSAPCLSMKKSASEPLLQLDPDITIEFEGDGPLGIVWVNNENDAYVGEIADRTVASEEINLKVGLKLILVGDYNCTHISYSDTMNLIRLKWQKFSHIKLTFSTDSKSPNSLISLSTFNSIYTLNLLLTNCFSIISLNDSLSISFILYLGLFFFKLSIA